MKNLKELQTDFLLAAILRGHNIAWSGPYHGERSSVNYATCKDCGMEGGVKTNPMPNETEVFGEIVALECK
jgi:hypothetical protein